MTFYNEIQKYDWDRVAEQIYSKTDGDVLKALAKNQIDLNDFQALISPAAAPYL